MRLQISLIFFNPAFLCDVKMHDDNLNNDFIKRTIEVWQPLSERELTEEDAREIIHNITGFFRILLKWENAQSGVKNHSEISYNEDEYINSNTSH